MHKPVFEGLVIDETGKTLSTTYIGDEPVYVIDDAGFKRHIPAEQIDRAVLKSMQEQLAGNEDLIAEQSAQMMGQDDLFTRAMIINQLKNLDKHFDQLLEIGIPAEARAYLGMMGFKVIVNLHGEVIHVVQPSAPADGGGEGGED